MSDSGTLLLDTHVALWWLLAAPELPTATQRAISAAQSVHVSAVTTWEVAIKRAIGKLTLVLPDAVSFPEACRGHGFTLTDVTHADAEAVAALPPARRDPFDRLLAATVRRRGWTLVTRDPAFVALGVATLWHEGT